MVTIVTMDFLPITLPPWGGYAPLSEARLVILDGVAGGRDAPVIQDAMVVGTDEGKIRQLAYSIGRTRFLDSVR